MKRIGFLALLMCIFLFGCAETAPVERDIFAMDTLMNIRIWGEKEAMNSVCNKINELDALLSAEDENSDIYRLNHDGFAIVKDDTVKILSDAISYSEETAGAFDPTVYPLVCRWKGETKPLEEEMRSLLPYVGCEHIIIDGNKVTLAENAALDLGAIGKGYAAQQCIEYLKKQNVEAAILSLGGNVQTLGTKPDGSKWAIGIANPQIPNESIAIVRFTGSMALVTSGSYQRYYEFEGEKYHHILNPKTGYPAENELSSVTILTRDGTMADAFSTALFVMGLDKACEFWRSRTDFEAVFILKDGSIYATEGIAPLLSECEFTVIER